MEQQYNKYKIKSLLKRKHGVDLTDPQIETIESVYSEFYLDVIINSLFRRIVNFIIGSVCLLLFFLLRESPSEKWFLIILIFVYFLYKVTMIIKNYKHFRKLNSQSNARNVES